MNGVAAGLLTIGALLVVYRLVAPSGTKRGFNSRRAATRVTSATGPNMAVLLAVGGVASLIIDTAETAGPKAITAIVATAIALIGVMALNVAWGSLLAGVVGVVAGAAAAWHSRGPAGAIAYLVLVGLCLTLLMFLRGFVRG